MHDQTAPEMFTTAEAAEQLGISVRQFQRLCRAHAVEPGGTARKGQVRFNLYSHAAIEYLRSQRDAVTPERVSGGGQPDSHDADILYHEIPEPDSLIDLGHARLLSQLHAAQAASLAYLSLAARADQDRGRAEERAAAAHIRAEGLAEQVGALKERLAHPMPLFTPLPDHAPEPVRKGFLARLLGR